MTAAVVIALVVVVATIVGYVMTTCDDGFIDDIAPLSPSEIEALDAIGIGRPWPDPHVALAVEKPTSPWRSVDDPPEGDPRKP